MSLTKEKNRALVYKALIDPDFRKQLATQPAKALGVTTLTPEKQKMIKTALAAIEEIKVKLDAAADELLCSNGGPCGIARVDIAAKNKKTLVKR